MTFPLTPEQFATLTKNLQTASGVQFRPANPLAGVISNSDVTLAYSYDGKGTLTVDITAAHSWGMKLKLKAASQEQIHQHIADMLKDSLS